MPIEAFELAGLSGEFVDGSAHLETDVELELGRVGDRIVLTGTAERPAAPDSAVRAELRPEEADALRRALAEAIGEA